MPEGKGYNVTSSGTNSQVCIALSALLPYLHDLDRLTVVIVLLENCMMHLFGKYANLFLQGNHYCSRDYGSSASNSNSYHYSNT